MGRVTPREGRARRGGQEPSTHPTRRGRSREGGGGRPKVYMGDGVEAEIGPGEAAAIPPGHEAELIGRQTVCPWTSARSAVREAVDALPKPRGAGRRRSRTSHVPARRT